LTAAGLAIRARASPLDAASNAKRDLVMFFPPKLLRSYPKQTCVAVAASDNTDLEQIGSLVTGSNFLIRMTTAASG
jgi:hypothetical protein